MGRSGPLPKRSEEVMGHRIKREMAERTADQAPGAAEVPIPPPDDNLHPIARDWYESLGKSGEHRFYEPSDWPVARYVAENMSRQLRDTERMNANMFSALMSAASDLLATEGARRGLRIELQRPNSEP